MMAIVDHCLACGAPIEQPVSGRRRLYCSSRCRQAAHRARRRELFAVLVGGGADLAGDIPDLPPNPDDAVIAAVAGAWQVVDRLAGGAAVARPQLSWRCKRASKELAGILRQYFAAPR
jgi:predicted nucleic acid-binding Zn ribbon protein